MNSKQTDGKDGHRLWWLTGIAGGLIGIGVTAFIHRRRIMAKAKSWLQPVTARISSPFGYRTHPVTGERKLHNGIDLPVPVGTQVRCPMDGVVSSVFYTPEGGNQITIRHDNGFQTGYAHLSKTLVKKGEKVKRGYVIALSGNTGRSTGPHVHLTLRDPSGALTDPAKAIYAGVT